MKELHGVDVTLVLPYSSTFATPHQVSARQAEVCFLSLVCASLVSCRQSGTLHELSGLPQKQFPRPS